MNQKSRFIKILPFVIAYFLLSCRSKSYVDIPKDILQPDSMVAVLSDVNILQSAAQLGYSPYRGDTTLQMGYQSLYKKHHLTDSSYNMNMRFYCDHAKLLDSVYEKVLNNLNQQKLGLMGPVQGSDKKTK